MIYFQFIQTLLNHMASKEKGDVVTFRDVNDYKEDLCKIGELAFNALLQDSLYFPVNKVPDHFLTTKLIEAGLFQLLNMSALNPSKAVHFIHKSVQEYLASFFLTEELSAQKDKKKSLFKVDSVEKIFKMTEVFKFALEMSGEAARDIVIHLGMAAKKDGLTEYSFDNESPRTEDLTAEQRNCLNLCTELFFCCSADTRKELFPTFLSSLGGVLVFNPKQLNVTVAENLLRTAAPLMYIFFPYSRQYTEQDYRNLITLTQQLNAVIVSCSGEMKASEFLQKYPWRSADEFFLKKEIVNTYLYFSEIVKRYPNDVLPFEMIKALISLVEATNKTKINRGGESSEQACSTHALSRVWGIDARPVNRSEVELLSDVLPFLLAPQVIVISGEDCEELDSDIAKKILSEINPTHRLKILILHDLNIQSSAAGFIAKLSKHSPNLEELNLSYNPLLGEGVDAIVQHLGSTPHLRILDLLRVKMTAAQVEHLSEAAMKHSSITYLWTDYHYSDGNPLPGYQRPSDDSSESGNDQEQDEEDEDSEDECPSEEVISLYPSSESDNKLEQIQTGLASDPHVKPEQVSSSSPSLDTRPSSRDAPTTFQVPGSLLAGGTLVARAFLPAAHGPSRAPLSVVPRIPVILGHHVSLPLPRPPPTDLGPPSTSLDDSVD